MFRRLRQATTLEEAAEAVEPAGCNGQRRVRRAVLTVLRDGTTTAIVNESNLHRLPAFTRGVCRGHHVRPVDPAGEPFVPVAVAVFLEATIGDEISVERRTEGKGR